LTSSQNGPKKYQILWRLFRTIRDFIWMQCSNG